MPADQIDVNPEALRRCASLFDRAAARADGILQTLQAALSAQEPAAGGDGGREYRKAARGSDDLTREFQKEYEGTRNQLVPAVQGIGAMLRGFAAGVRGSADAFEQVDEVLGL
jgi:uncharacterized protein YukE